MPILISNHKLPLFFDSYTLIDFQHTKVDHARNWGLLILTIGVSKINWTFQDSQKMNLIEHKILFEAFFFCFSSSMQIQSGSKRYKFYYILSIVLRRSTKFFLSLCVSRYRNQSYDLFIRHSFVCLFFFFVKGDK